MWDFDPTKNRLVEKPIQARRVGPPPPPPSHLCAECPNPCENATTEPEQESLEEDFMVIQDPTNKWSRCAFCGSPIEDGDITLPIARWFRIYSQQDAPYPIEAGSVHAHLTCAVYAAGIPERSQDECAKMVELCMEMWDEFNGFEKGAINDFHDMVVKGRALTPRQQHFLQRMATYAQEQKEAIAKDPSLAKKRPLTDEQIPQYFKFIQPDWRHLTYAQRRRFDEIQNNYLVAKDLNDYERQSLKRLQGLVVDLQQDESKKSRPPRWMMAKEVIEEIFERSSDVALNASDTFAISRLYSIWAANGDLHQEDQHDAMRELAIVINEKLTQKKKKRKKGKKGKRA
jgi:hypothetical protein